MASMSSHSGCLCYSALHTYSRCYGGALYRTSDWNELANGAGHHRCHIVGVDAEDDGDVRGGGCDGFAAAL
jgi:hypothetical protein